ncbi:MAG: hypothetical protein ABIH03_14945 [Pseudomonadota bacterium]
MDDAVDDAGVGCRHEAGVVSSNSRDLVIAMLADSEAEWIETVVDLTIERDLYRDLTREAIHQLHAMREENQAQRRTIAFQREENRTLRAARCACATEAA